ncbi:hypothetical protein JCM33374_g609 [Metschnikowia sp. JCM 33374]|nr:hypothetical protein JCM33374_g609 [Metschnikowia sp. JCM 33374]
MRNKTLISIFVGFFSILVSAGQGQISKCSIRKTASLEPRKLVETPSLKDQGNFDEINTGNINSVVTDELRKIVSLLLEFPASFELDLNEILKPYGFSVDPKMMKRDSTLHRRDFWYTLHMILLGIISTVGIICAFLALGNPAFIGPASACFTLYGFLKGL